LATPERAADTQRTRLSAQLQFAATLPFYAERFTRYGVDPDGSDPAAELAKLPVLTKADIRANTPRMLNPRVRGGLVPAITGGTTGQTLRFYSDQIRAAETMGTRLCLQQRLGVRPGDRRAYVWGSPIELRVARVKRWRDRLLNELVLNCFELGPAQMDAHLTRLRRYQPRLMYGFSSALALLARHGAQGYGPRDFPALKAVVATGEPLTPDQRAQIGATFGAPVIAEYGARESGLIGYECPHGALHVLTRNVHLEVLVEGRPVPAGALGDIVCTPLNAWAQPLLRYGQGDVGALLPSDAAATCPCGWKLPVLRLESGRTNGFIALPGGRLCSGVIASYICRDQPGVVQYRMHQRTLDDFDIWIVPGTGFGPPTLQTIVERCRRLFGLQVRVHWRLVDEIPAQASGKRSDFLSDVASDYTRFEVVQPGAMLAAAGIER
jgi:phenylacetate-CoA ligase